MQYHVKPSNTGQYHAIPCNTMQYYSIQSNTMKLKPIPCIIINCWRSVPLPCGQYMAIFIYQIMLMELVLVLAGVIFLSYTILQGFRSIEIIKKYGRDENAKFHKVFMSWVLFMRCVAHGAQCREGWKGSGWAGSSSSLSGAQPIHSHTLHTLYSPFFALQHSHSSINHPHLKPPTLPI